MHIYIVIEAIYSSRGYVKQKKLYLFIHTYVCIYIYVYIDIVIEAIYSSRAAVYSSQAAIYSRHIHLYTAGIQQSLAVCLYHIPQPSSYIHCTQQPSRHIQQLYVSLAVYS